MIINDIKKLHANLHKVPSFTNAEAADKLLTEKNFNALRNWIISNELYPATVLPILNRLLNIGHYFSKKMEHARKEEIERFAVLATTVYDWVDTGIFNISPTFLMPYADTMKEAQFYLKEVAYQNSAHIIKKGLAANKDELVEHLGTVRAFKHAIKESYKDGFLQLLLTIPDKSAMQAIIRLAENQLERFLSDDEEINESSVSSSEDEQSVSSDESSFADCSDDDEFAPMANNSNPYNQERLMDFSDSEEEFMPSAGSTFCRSRIIEDSSSASEGEQNVPSDEEEFMLPAGTTFCRSRIIEDSSSSASEGEQNVPLHEEEFMLPAGSIFGQSRIIEDSSSSEVEMAPIEIPQNDDSDVSMVIGDEQNRDDTEEEDSEDLAIKYAIFHNQYQFFARQPQAAIYQVTNKVPHFLEAMEPLLIDAVLNTKLATILVDFLKKRLVSNHGIKDTEGLLEEPKDASMGQKEVLAVIENALSDFQTLSDGIDFDETIDNLASYFKKKIIKENLLGSDDSALYALQFQNTYNQDLPSYSFS